MSEMLKLKQLHFTVQHWRANVADGTLNAIEVKEILECASGGTKDMNYIKDFVNGTAGPDLQHRLRTALEGDDRGCCLEHSDLGRSIMSLYYEWAEDQGVMGNERWYGMKTEMALIDLTHYYTNASFVQWAFLWVKTCLLQWAIRSRGGDDTRPQPEILTYEQTYNGYMIAQLKNGKSKEYILEQVDAYGKHGNRGEKMPLSWPL